MVYLNNQTEQEKKRLELNQELKINNADHHLLMDLLQNPRPANDEMKKLIALSKEII